MLALPTSSQATIEAHRRSSRLAVKIAINYNETAIFKQIFARGTGSKTARNRTKMKEPKKPLNKRRMVRITNIDITKPCPLRAHEVPPPNQILEDVLIDDGAQDATAVAGSVDDAAVKARKRLALTEETTVEKNKGHSVDGAVNARKGLALMKDTTVNAINGPAARKEIGLEKKKGRKMTMQRVVREEVASGRRQFESDDAFAQIYNEDTAPGPLARALELLEAGEAIEADLPEELQYARELFSPMNEPTPNLNAALQSGSPLVLSSEVTTESEKRAPSKRTASMMASGNLKATDQGESGDEDDSSPSPTSRMDQFFQADADTALAKRAKFMTSNKLNRKLFEIAKGTEGHKTKSTARPAIKAAPLRKKIQYPGIAPLREEPEDPESAPLFLEIDDKLLKKED